MLRRFAIAAMFALAVPTIAMTVAVAQEPHEHGHPPPGHPGPHGPPPGGPHMGGPMMHPGPGPHPGPFRGGPFVFHGHPFAWHPVHYPHPWAYPPGYGYRAWGIGAILPPLFWQSPTYYYTGWAGMGLPPPDPGYQYVQYGPDLLLVNVATGQVVQAFPGAFN
jgi:Nickel/cobalt transporter regulator